MSTYLVLPAQIILISRSRQNRSYAEFSEGDLTQTRPFPSGIQAILKPKESEGALRWDSGRTDTRGFDREKGVSGDWSLEQESKGGGSVFARTIVSDKARFGRKTTEEPPDAI